MPRTNIDYSKTVIYKIVCNDLNVEECYVGFTTDFTIRKNSHKSRCCNPNSAKYNYKIYSFIRENGGWENWTMIEIEKYPCNDGNEASSRERYWYEICNSKLNVQKPLQSKKEYGREYNIINKNKISDRGTERIVCDCGVSSTKWNMHHHIKTKKHQAFMCSQNKI